MPPAKLRAGEDNFIPHVSILLPWHGIFFLLSNTTNMKISSIAAASLLAAAIGYNDNVAVNSFQISPSFNSAAVSTTLRHTPYTTILYSSNDNNDESLTTAKELELNELSTQLEQAKERFTKSRNNVEVLQTEKEGVVSTTDSIINKLKSGFA